MKELIKKIYKAFNGKLFETEEECE